MAVVQNPIIGRATGQAGGMVFYKNRSQNVIRSKPVQVAPSSTPRQVAQRNALALLVSIFRLASSVIKVGYRNFLATLSAYNKFVSVNLKSVFDFTNLESVVFDPEALQFSSGSMLPTIFMADYSEGSFTVEWSNSSLAAGQSLTDKLNVILVDPTGSAVVSYLGAAERSDGDFTIPFVDTSVVGLSVSLHVFFSSTIDNSVSTSQFLGTFQLPE